ncbi:MAG: Undecaprenyl-phosphate 4-deoxy-4-formamido-L-arabinose transferase, partial [Candidatus Daviesbacteria bacterium GW2011_GWA1_36_8]
KKIKKTDPKVKILKLRGGFGKSVALQVGFENSKGEIIITLDADLQDNPDQIYKFLNKLDEGYDLVSGWKKKRYDPFTKVIPSRILNYVTSFLTGVKIHDINCGFKAYRKKVLENINIYGELYRFIPVFAAKQNYKIAEVIVNHRKRKFGITKFGWERNIKGLLDLITITFLTGYFRRPGHFFGTLGLTSLFIGTVIGIYITYLRVTTGSIQDRHPLLFLGMLLIIVGIQLISTGLLAEMNLYNREKQSLKWVVEKKV